MSLGSAPTSASQIGYVISGTFLSSSTNISVTGITTNMASVLLIPGIWIIAVQCNINATNLTLTDSNAYRFNLSNSSATYQGGILVIGMQGITFASSTSTTPSLAGSAIVTVSTNTTYYLCANIISSTGSATVGTGSIMNAIRVG